MSQFELPARPWKDADIKYMMANEALLDNETRAELGLKPSAMAPEAESTPSEGEGENKTPENPQTPKTPEVSGQGSTGDAPQVNTPSTGDANIPQNTTGNAPVNNQNA
jgi:hypothetical protein